MSTLTVEMTDTSVDARVREIVLQLRVNRLALSSRTSRVLLAAGLTTVGDLVGSTDNDLLQVRGFGRRSLREVRNCLALMGFERAPCAEEPPRADRVHRTALGELPLALLLSGCWENNVQVADALVRCLTSSSSVWLLAGLRQALPSLRDLAFCAHAQALEQSYRSALFGRTFDDAGPRLPGFWDAARTALAVRCDGVQRFALRWEAQGRVASAAKAEAWVVRSTAIVAVADRSHRGEFQVQVLEEELFVGDASSAWAIQA